MKLICIDLFCGLGGWTQGFLSEGYQCIGFDIEQHVYGEKRYPAQLVLQDVLTLHGAQFRDVAAIVASPPCQEFSYMAMPWQRGKRIAGALRGDGDFPEGYAGSKTIADLNALFNACFRLQTEASQAAGRHIPLVVENVKGAQPWVGKAKANYGSFYLWGDVRSVGGRIVAAHCVEFGAASVKAFHHRKVVGKYAGNGSWKTESGEDWRSPSNTGQKNAHVGSGSWFPISHGKDNGETYGAIPNRGQAIGEGLKVPGMNFHDHEKGKPGRSFQSAAVEGCGTKQGGDWFGKGEDMSISRRTSSKSNSRKAASAAIAEIPFDLASHVARCFKPSDFKEGIA